MLLSGDHSIKMLRRMQNKEGIGRPIENLPNLQADYVTGQDVIEVLPFIMLVITSVWQGCKVPTRDVDAKAIDRVCNHKISMIDRD